MAIGKQLSIFEIPDAGGGCNYSPDVTALQSNESPNAMNVVFKGDTYYKRSGRRKIAAASGQVYSLADVGVSSLSHVLIAHIGEHVYSMENLSGSFTTIRNSAPIAISENTFVKQLLVQTYYDYTTPYYWTGSGEMNPLSDSAPSFIHALEFQGYVLGSNIEDYKLRVYYEDINTMVGGSYATYFTLPSGAKDDEVTSEFILNGRCYITTKTNIFRVSFIGGDAVFEYRAVVSGIGVVPRSVQIINTDDYGQLAILLGYDMRVYVFDGTYVRDISRKYRVSSNDTEIALDQINRSLINNSFGLYDNVDDVYRLFVTKRGQADNYYALNVDVQKFAYYPFDNMPVSTAIVAQDLVGRYFRIAGDYDGNLYKMFGTYNSDDGVVIKDYLELAPFASKTPALSKVRTANLHFLPTAKYNIVVEDKSDFEAVWKRRADVPMYSNGDRFLGYNTSLGEQFKLGSGREVLMQSVNVPATVNTYRMRIRTDTEAGVLCSYNTGTVSGTGGTTSVSGSGTVWSSDMTVNNKYKIWIDADGHRDRLYDFTYVSTTSGTVSELAAGDFAGASYEIFKMDYAGCMRGWVLSKVEILTEITAYGKGPVIQ